MQYPHSEHILQEDVKTSLQLSEQWATIFKLLLIIKQQSVKNDFCSILKRSGKSTNCCIVKHARCSCWCLNLFEVLFCLVVRVSFHFTGGTW